MATDSTHLLPSDTSIETETDMSASGSDLGSVQLAAASPDAIPVNIPRGQQVVVIPVKPGQIIELPTDSPDGLLAKLGADGNLAIVVDGRTIILQGYAEANAESPIKIVTNDGDFIEITDVIVATNPDVALDIQTAAGPAAAGAQGGTAGADAASSGIFVPFAAGPLLGGIDAVGVLGATQLAYKNIDDERELFPIEEEKEQPAPTPEITIGAESGLDTICVPEDSQGEAVAVHASTDATSHLTTIVISGFPIGGGGFSFSFLGLDLSNTDIIDTIAADGKVTIVFNDAVTTDFSGSFIVTPAGDSDVDLGTLTAEVEAVNNVDPTVKAGSSDDAFVRVDAIADGDDVGDDGDADKLGVSIVLADGGDLNTSFQAGEAGFVHISASFDDFKDGSETHQLTITAPAGFTFGAPGALPAGVSLVSNDGTTIVLSVDSKDGDGQNGVGSFFLDVPVTYNGSQADGATGNFVATVSATETPTDEECDTTNNSDTATHATAGVIAETPTPNVQIGAEAGLDHVCVFEDTTSNPIPVTASTNAGSHLTTLIISGFPISGPYTVDLSGLTQPGVVSVVNNIAVDGTVTITFDGTAASYSGTFTVTPSPDSDVDIGILTATVEAANNVDPTVKDDAIDQANVVVDAVADGDDVGDDGDGSVLDVAINVEDGIDPNNSFQVGEFGTVLVTASFDDFKDGSEVHTLLIVAPAGFAFQTPLVGLPTGVTVIVESPNVIQLAVDSTDAFPPAGVPNVFLPIPVQYLGGLPDGVTPQFIAQVTTTEIPTDLECTVQNNSDTKTALDDTTVAGVPTTEISLNTEGREDVVCVPEDSDGVQIPVTATTTPGSHLTTIVISGFPTDAVSDGWVFDFTGLDNADTSVDFSKISVDGTVTITFDNATTENFGGSFTVTPPADSDVDLGTLTATVEGVNNFDPSVKDTDADAAFVRVDAIADGDNVGDDGDGDVFGVTIAVSDGGDVNATFQDGEVGNVHVTASFDDYKDGSESHTLTVEAPDGFTFDTGNVGTLPTGVTLDLGNSNTTKLVFIVDSKDGDGNPGVSDLTLDIPVTYGGGEEDGESGDFTATVKTIENPSDAECDKSNNTDSATATDDVTIASAPTTDIRIGAEGNTEAICVPEDAVNVLIPVVASTTAGSHLTTIVISGFPTDAVSDGWVFNFTGLDNADTSVDFSQISVNGTVTITFVNNTTTNFNGNFTVSPPADSDVDLGTLTAEVTAVNNVDPTVKDTDSDDAFVRVDAIADGDDGDGEKLGVTITSIADGGDANSTFKTGETGTVNINATFDDYKDGSETHILTVEAPDNFSFDTGNVGTLPPGVTLDASSTSDKLVFNVDSSNPGGVGSLDLHIPVTYNGGQQGGTSGNFTATVTAQETPSDLECDTGNNFASASDTEVASINDGPSIDLDPEDPEAKDNTAVVSDEGFPTGNPDSDPASDDTNELSFTNAFTISDPDGDPLTVKIATDVNTLPAFTFGGTNDPVQWTLSNSDKTLTGTANGQPAITVVFDTTTMTYTVTLLQPLNHPNTSIEDELSFDLKIEVSDGSASDFATLTVELEDDKPVITSFTTKAALIVDETDGVAAANETDPVGGNLGVAKLSAAALFDLTSSFGGDGFKDADNNDIEDADAIAYELDVLVANGSNSNLIDTLSGDVVTLHQVSATLIEGRVGGTVVFSLSIDANTGETTLTQFRAVVHNDPNDPDQSGSPAVLANDLVGVKVTVTDGDGDQASQTANLNNVVKFEDDGPTITSFTVKAGAALIVDETDGVAAANETDPIGGNLGVAKLSAAALFDLTSSFGSDGFKDVDDNDVEDPDAIAYELDLLVADGSNSNLTDTLSGDVVTLHQVSATLIEGRVGGTIVFSLSIDANTGETTLTQNRAVVHNDPNDPDQAGSPAVLGNDLVGVKVTVTDGDLDHVSQTANLNNVVKFEDDGPTITSFTVKAGAALIVDETDGEAAANETDPVGGNLGVAKLSAAALLDLTSSFGSDGFKDANDDNVEDADAIAYELDVLVADGSNSNLVDTLTGSTVTLHQVSATLIEGRVGATVVFSLSIDANTGEATLTQFRAVVHDDPADPDESTSPAVLGNDLIGVKVTVTDGDLDHISQTANLNNVIKFEDDGPGAMAAEAAAITEDEQFNAPTDEAAGVAGDPTPDLGSSVSGDVSDNGSWGVDGFGGITQVQIGANTAVVVPDGGSTTVYWSQSGAYQGTNATNAAASLLVNSDGSYTFTQLDNMLISGAGEQVDLIGSAVFTGVDGDGDAATISLDLKVKDDIPGAMAAEAAAITEDEQFNAPTDEAAGVAGDPTPDLGSSVSGNVSDNGNWGADGFGRITQVQIDGNAAVAVPNGGSVTVYWGQDGTYQGTSSGGAAASLLVNSDGSYTFTQLDNMLISGVGEQIDLLGTATFTGIDGDGDTATVTMDLQVKDDIPVVTSTSNLIYANSSNPTPGGTGVFAYNIGADNRTIFSETSSDFVLPVLSGVVGANAISNVDVDWTSESATQATFTFAFDYVANPATPGVLTSATGTITFDKVAGTYTVQLASPLQGFSVVTTNTAVDIQGYDAGGSKEDNSGPADVFVAQLSDGFFVQFTGIKETDNKASGNLKAGVDLTFSDGELITQGQSDVIVSKTDMGIGSNTIQPGEVLDLNFYNTNPTGNLGLPQTASASSVFLEFFGIGSADLIVILKLQSLSNPLDTTTKAIIIENSDIFTTNASLPAGYGIFLDNNESAVIIEGNDYNSAGQDYAIIGMQVLPSSEGIAGTGINLNPATGAGGASTTTQVFDAADQETIKVVNIGFVQTTTTTLNANLQFDVAVKDADGDQTSTTSLDVDIVGGSNFTGTAAVESIQGSSGHDTITGGGGNDTIDVSQGNDTVKYTSKLDGNDVITGFDADSSGGQDKIDLDELFDNYGPMSGTRADHVNVADAGTDTQVRIDTDDNVGNGYEMVITLKNVADHTTVTVGSDVLVGS